MKKEYVKPQAVLTETLESFCENTSNVSGEYGLDHSTAFDDLFE